MQILMRGLEDFIDRRDCSKTMFYGAGSTTKRTIGVIRLARIKVGNLKTSKTRGPFSLLFRHPVLIAPIAG
jgi:hypothetical protein